MVCPEDRVETFQHLFIECKAATFLWEGSTPLLEAVRFNFADTHQGRLLGNVSGFDTSPVITAAWPEDPPTRDTILKWIRLMWTEIRGVTLKAI